MAKRIGPKPRSLLTTPLSRTPSKRYGRLLLSEHASLPKPPETGGRNPTIAIAKLRAMPPYPCRSNSLLRWLPLRQSGNLEGWLNSGHGDTAPSSVSQVREADLWAGETKH